MNSSLRKKTALCLVGLLVLVQTGTAGKPKPPVEAPQVYAAINRGGVVQVCRGWPMLLEVGLLHRRAFDLKVKALSLKSASGPWSNLLQIQISDSQGQSQNWPFHLANLPRTSVKLSNKTRAELLWYLAPAETISIAAGSYELEVVLDTTGTKNKWQDIERSVPVSIEIIDEPAVLSEAQAEAKHILFAQYAIALGDRQQALAHLETLLAQHPKNIGGLTFKAFLLEQSGDLTGALAACDAALEEVQTRFPDAYEPPENLEILRSRLRDKILGVR